MKLFSGKWQFWEEKKPPVGAETFCPSPLLAFYIPPCRKSILASEAGPSAVLFARRFRKSLKIKITGKTAGDSPHGEGKSRIQTFFANSVNMYSDCFVYSLLIIVYSLFLIIYSLFLIIYSLLIIAYS
jgi:hypothetical protein